MRRVCRIVALLATVLLVMACGAGEGARTPKKTVNNPMFTLHIDKKFSPAERDLLVGAFKDWERVTHGTVRFAVSTPFDSDLEEPPTSFEKECTYDAYVTKVHSSAKEVKKLDRREKAKVLGYTTSWCKQRVVAMVFDRLQDQKLYRQVAVHEAGHLVGLDHIPVPKESVMFPTVDKATGCATDLDMKQFCMLYACDWKEMKRCETP